MTNRALPNSKAPLVDNRGLATIPFYKFLVSVADAVLGNASEADVTALQQQIAAIQQEIDALPQTSYPVLQVLPPLFSSGLLQNGFAQIGIDLTQIGADSNIPEAWVFG